MAGAIRTLSLVFVLAFFSSCEEYPSPKPAAICGTSTAVIGVRDSALLRLCGCDQGTGTAVGGATFVCTVPVGTTVVFEFTSTELFHQIVPTGTPSIPPSAVSNPSAEPKWPSHAVKISAVGTYRFQDRFYPTITGQIIGR